MDQASLDRAIAELADNKQRWSRLSIPDRVAHLRKCITGTARVAERQVRVAAEAKGLSGSFVGEEWFGGPVVTVRNLRLLAQSLEHVYSHGTPQLSPGSVKVRPGPQVVADVFPTTRLERWMYRGYSAEVWMDPKVRQSALDQQMARIYRRAPQERSGVVGLVLSAGNVASIGPLDVIYKMFVEDQVCLLKLNPVNDYLGPFIEEAFASLVEEGFLRFAYGGSEVGAYLCNHEGIEAIHITGSDRTYDAIVFGGGAEGAARKASGERLNCRPITAELGNVSPVIVAPGSWSEAELRYQVENVATQMTNNAGFNCNAARVLVTWAKWPQREAFFSALRDLLRRLPGRDAYYPGAQERYDALLGAHPEAESFGERDARVLPWTLITGLDAANADEPCFREEFFCCVTSETQLEAADAEAFMQEATTFCNESLWGTLAASIIVDDKFALGPLERAIADLRYGSIALNAWPALSYGLGMPSWGAFPGHQPTDIQSGCGVVHNTFLFDQPQKSVVRGPFTSFPRSPWFVTNRQMHKLGPRMLALEEEPTWSKLVSVAPSAILGGLF